GGQVVERERGAPQLEVDRGEPRAVVLEGVEAQAGREQRPAQLVARLRDERPHPPLARVRDRRHGEREQEHDRGAHAAASATGPSTRRYPTPHTFTTNRSPRAPSLCRSRQAWLSSVRVVPIDRYPHTSRSSSSFVNTPLGPPTS